MKIEPKRSLGQNFLVDQKVVKDLVGSAEIGSGDVVVEVGAGTGVVTKELAKRAKRIIAVEFDRGLIPILEEELNGLRNVEIINQDILDLRLTDYLPAMLTLQAGDLQEFKVVGSIPYQITSPLIHKLLIEEPRPSLMVFLVQLEVAEKICANPPKATYFSNFVKAFGEAEIIRKVPPSTFYPQPKVNSAILKTTLVPSPYSLNPKSFSKFLHRGFQSPRKMLNKVFPERILKEAGIDADRRPQTLSLDEWRGLYHRTIVETPGDKNKLSRY